MSCKDDISHKSTEERKMRQILLEIPISMVIFLLISTGSVLKVFNNTLRYEVLTPITCMTIIFLLFLFGIVNYLMLGLFFVIALSIGIYFFAFLKLLLETKRQGIDYLKSILCSLISPCAILVLLFIMIETYANFGKQVAEWDEFSHWATVVKHMVCYNTLSYDQAHSFVYFKSYPPAMALFQYFVQRIVILLKPEVQFSEWHLFFAYHLLEVSFLLPFIGKMNFRRPAAWFSTVFVIMALKIVNFSPISSLLIDPFLGLISGAGMAMLSLYEIEHYPIYRIMIILVIGIITLTKDAGMLFACTIAICFVTLVVRERDKGDIKSIFFTCALTFLFAICPKALWTICLWKNDVRSVFSKIDFVSLFNVLSGREVSYRTEVISQFFRQLTRPYTFITFFGKNISSLMLLLLLLSLALLINRVYIYHFPRKSAAFNLYYLILCGCSVLFMVGLLLVYMYKLSPFEGIHLASFDRYMQILFYMLFFYIMLSLIAVMECLESYKYLVPVILFGICFTTGACSASFRYYSRAPVWYANELRKQYNSFFKAIELHTSEDSVIYFISQNNEGYDFWCARYCLMPRIVNPYNLGERTWTIGSQSVDDVDNTWRMQMTADEWKAKLLSDYDYVALFRLNEDFFNDYSDLFNNPEDIEEESLFYVNKRTGLLEKSG